MGNCMKTCKVQHNQVVKSQREEKKDGFEKSCIRVKLVLTKDELDWLLLQTKSEKGKNLEDLLVEIEKGRQNVALGKWIPSLESIMEAPEVLEIDR